MLGVSTRAKKYKKEGRVGGGAARGGGGAQKLKMCAKNTNLLRGQI